MATQVAGPKAPPIQTAEQTAAPERSFWMDGLRELYASKVAFVSAIFLLLLVLVAVFAHLIAPHDPRAMSLPNRALFPSWVRGRQPGLPARHRRARTIGAGTSTATSTSCASRSSPRSRPRSRS